MNVSFQSIHFDADRKLLDFIEKKLSKLESLSNKIINAEVYLRLDKSENSSNKITEIKINIPGHTLFSKEQCKTFEEAADLAVESLRNQLKKAVEKMRTN
jgi:putative sigma-54 modulation protein